MKRNSTVVSEYRKLPGDARQLREQLELASERLPETFLKEKGVDVDGRPGRYPGRIYVSTETVSDERAK